MVTSSSLIEVKGLSSRGDFLFVFAFTLKRDNLCRNSCIFSMETKTKKKENVKSILLYIWIKAVMKLILRKAWNSWVLHTEDGRGNCRNMSVKLRSVVLHLGSIFCICVVSCWHVLQQFSFFFCCSLENKTWLDSVKNLSERVPDSASRLMSKNEKEHKPTSGITFVNYSEFSNVDSGICAVKNWAFMNSCS